VNRSELLLFELRSW